MTLMEIVSRLVAIKISRRVLDEEENQLMSQLSTVHTNGAVISAKVGRPKGSRSKLSYYTRQKLAKMRKDNWDAMSATERQERIRKMQAGRKVKK